MADEHPLSNMNPDDFPEPMMARWRSAVYDELCALEDLLFPDPPKRAPQDRLSDEAWEDFIETFMSAIPDSAETVQDVAFGSMPKTAASQALHRRIRQSQAALGPLPNHWMEVVPQTKVLPSHAVLVPLRLRPRLVMLLDHQYMPMVWTRAISTHLQKVTAERPPRAPV